MPNVLLIAGDAADARATEALLRATAVTKPCAAPCRTAA